MVECRADALQVGDALVPAFTFPDGYRFRDDVRQCSARLDGSLRVTAIEPAGTADIYTFGVKQTGCFFVSAGVLCKAEDDTPGSGA